MAKNELKKFRHEIAVLKKKGLIDNVDARSVTPTTKLKKLVDRFDDVLSGKATPVKLSKSETKNLKEAGYDVYKGRVLFPHSAGEKVGVSHGHAKTRQPNGIERVTIPIPYHKLDSYLKDIAKNEKTIGDMKKKDEYFAFRFHGHKSIAIYRDIDLLIEDLERYHDIQNSIRTGNSKDMNEAYRNLEIYKVHRARNWDNAPNPTSHRKSSNKAKYKRAKKKLKSAPEWKKRLERERNAEKQQRFRDSMSATEKQVYKKEAKKRAKRSRKNQKKTSRN